MKRIVLFLSIFISGASLHAQDVVDIKLMSSSDTINKGAVVPNTIYLPFNLGERMSIRNVGTGAVTLGLKVITNSVGWMPVGGQPGLNQFRLFGIFHKYTSAINTNDFQNNDLILSAMNMSTSNVYAIDLEDNTEIVKGYNIPPDKEVNLFFRFDSPGAISVADGTPVQIRILIKAIFFEPLPDEELVKPSQTLLTPFTEGPNHTLKFSGLADYLGEKKVFAIRIMDMNGRIVQEISDKNEWDGTDSSGKFVRSGVYIYQYRYKSRSINGLIVVAY